MKGITIRRARKADSKQIIDLLVGLANFERLEPPSEAGRNRILADLFERSRIEVFVAEEKGKVLGYALYFFTYSSFLAKPTLYLEDIFVLEQHRKRGVGFSLFRRCVDEAIAQGCGRMEWAVLTWNEKATQFYEKLGARRMSDWYVYRLDERDLRRVPRQASSRMQRVK